MFNPPLKLFWPLFAKLTVPLETITRLLKLMAALLLKVRLPVPYLMSEPLAAKPPKPPKEKFLEVLFTFIAPGISVPVKLIAGEAEPVSLKVTLSRVKNLLGPPLFQFKATVSQTLAVPSPTQVRLAPPAPPTMSLTAFGVEVVSKANEEEL